MNTHKSLRNWIVVLFTLSLFLLGIYTAARLLPLDVKANT